MIRTAPAVAPVATPATASLCKAGAFELVAGAAATVLDELVGEVDLVTVDRVVGV